ncbi:MAG: sigma-54-dependent Fis family transcriptional regulator [Gammaproteobacteria bacterium HGW-Gammaproteobacteria-1]|jgi:two-component system response regulator FlrC|nr:MAG: sigma-54-dependent Fis family transcriptional regulator [Gammaproteobacteria bacterium HGW-Gammaproteobacteria-1]
MEQRILVVEDDAALAEALTDTLELEGWQVAHAADGMAALDVLAREEIALVLSDVHMERMDGHTLLQRLRAARPDLPVILMTAYATVQKAVSAMQDGAVDYLVKPFAADVLLQTVTRHLGGAAAPSGDEPVAEDAASRHLLQLARRVAATDATVLLTGESGTGKEVMARYIHRHSPRAERPFIAINCAAIPENMLEATLFGYEKGAFTGAHKTTPGKFEQAQGGTLLLDEISEMDLGLQAKLLRVLQEREVERLGGGRVLALDVRVLATSNRDMRDAVQAGRFREDLYYRLNVFPLHLPPLRERRADIVPLARVLLAQLARKMGRPAPHLAAAAEKALAGYPWPGNVREMDNLLQRALIMQDGREIQPADLLFEIAPEPLPAAPVHGALEEDDADLSGGLKQHEHQLIVDALRQGSRQAAAERLGISPRTLRYKLARLREEGYTV